MLVSLRRNLFFTLLLALLFALAACGGSGDEDTTASDDGATTEEEAETDSGEVEEVVIGYTGPLSGPAAFYGENTVSGMEIAVDEINEAGGFEVDGKQYKLRLNILDDEYMPNDAAQNAKRIAQEDDAKFIFTPHSGGVYAIQVFNEEDDFILMAYTSERGILEEGNTMTIRIPPNYDAYIQPFSEYLMERFGNKIAFLPPATQFGIDWAKDLGEGWPALGGEIVYEGQIDFTKDTDFYTIVTNALENDPDVLFIGGASEPTARVAKQARDLGFEGGFLIMDQAKMDEMAAVYDGDYEFLEGSVGVTPLIYSDYPGTDTFVDKYNDLYDKNPGSEAGLHYFSIYALVETMKAAGTVDDTEALLAAMDEGVRNVPEENQVYTFDGVDEEGGFIPRWNMSVVEDGEIINTFFDEDGIIED